MRDRGLEPPPYLPEIAHAVLPWTRRYVGNLSARDGLSLHELWDEAIAALLRAATHYDPALGYAFSTYACNSVIRGCWRYVARAEQRSRRLGVRMSVHEAASWHASDDPALSAPSAEDEVSARECVRDFSPAPRPSSRSVPDAVRR